MPFNMNTFNKLWGIVTPEEAKRKIELEKKQAGIEEPKNLEEQAISLVGKTIYEKLVKGYTEKQWGKKATELPSFIIKRLPVRFIYDNNYFNDIYQGIPVSGYTQIIEKMLDGIEVRLNCDYFEHKKELKNIAEKIIFTGPIDKYYNYRFGELEYRSLKFETEELDLENYQGNAVVNYTEYEVPYTRIIEHKHFEYGPGLGKIAEGKTAQKTVITKEYPDHGYNGSLDESGEEAWMRQCPLLLIKGMGETHDTMQISQAPISFEDLQEAYTRLLDGKQSTAAFDWKEGDVRERRFLKYSFLDEDHMQEYVQTGYASDMNTMIPTGREYNR